MKTHGKWVYLYRAVDREGKTVDFRLSANRDVAAAKAFFCKAIKRQGGAPRTITLDGYAASHRAVREMKADGSLPEATKLRSPKYLTDIFDNHFPRDGAIFLRHGRPRGKEQVLGCKPATLPWISVSRLRRPCTLTMA